MIVGLFENSAELKVLRSRPDAGQITLVALTHEADFAADESDVEYYTIEDLYDEVELYRVTMPNFDHAFELCELLDVHLERVMGAPLPGFTFFLLQHDLRCILDRFWHRTWTLMQLTQRFSSCQIIGFAPATDGLNPADGQLPSASLYSLLIPAVAKSLNTSLELLPRAKTVSLLETQSMTSVARELLAKAKRKLYRMVRYRVAQRLINTLLWFRAQLTSTDYPMLVTTAWYPGVRETVRAWTGRHGAHLRIVRPPKWSSGQNGKATMMENVMVAAWPAVADAIRSTGYLNVDGVDIADLTLARLCWLWNHRAGDAIREARHIAPIYERQSKAVLFTQHPAGESELPNLIAARATGCPVVAYQHGAYGMAVPDRHANVMEIQPSDVFLVYGSGTARDLASGFGSDPRLCHRPLPNVGSIKLEGIWRTRTTRPDPIYDVCYVTTYGHGDARYMERNHHPPIALGRLERSLLRLLAGHPQRSVLVKTVNLYGQYQFITKVVRRLAPTNIRILTDGQFSDMAWCGRLIVIESPSTVLLEACATNLPILCLVNLDWLNVDSHWLDLLQRRAMVATSVDDFLRQLDDILTGWPPQELDSVDDSFLLEYGMHRADGRSAERAVDALAQVLNEKRIVPANY